MCVTAAHDNIWCRCMGSEADNSGYLNSTKEWKKKLFDNRNTITSLLSSFNYLGVNGMILATPKYVKYDAMHLVQSDVNHADSMSGSCHLLQLYGVRSGIRAAKH